METDHRVVVGDSRRLGRVADDGVELVVTSPPYPMIEMWDDLFADLDPAIGEHLDAGEGRKAFESMHDQLGAVWDELARVLVDGGIACVNVGDATRKVDGSFRVWGNHSRIIDAFEQRGFEPLPEILWRKPANSGAKFMGSGMLPPNAYVTLEHEYILLFRNGEKREFEPHAERRYESSYFWEERNRWFSDLWTDVGGELQALDGEGLRERSGAYPLAIPYRLVSMFSVYGDTVLDPFWGTGTTTLAAMAAARDSIGYERDAAFTRAFDDRVADVPSISRTVGRRRLADHRAFVDERGAERFAYEADRYGFPVTTKQEQSMRLYTVETVAETPNGYRAVHEPLEAD